MTPEIRRILQREFPTEHGRYFDPMVIGGGDDPSLADRGAAAILLGTKTATSSAWWEYPDGRLPFIGALSVLLDGQGRPVAIIETERLETVPFAAVAADFAEAYGEGDGSLGWWQTEMGAWYRRSADQHGAEFSGATPILCEWIGVARRL